MQLEILEDLEKFLCYLKVLQTHLVPVPLEVQRDQVNQLQGVLENL
jgi:hypothetical protein